MNRQEVEYYFSGIPKTPFEIFTILYGVIVINIYDCLCPRFLGYHLFLLIVYVLPYLPLLVMEKLDIKNIVWLGILISLFNDVFFFFFARILGVRSFSITWYYSNWLIPHSTYLGTWDFLFFRPRVYSWTMSLSIYIRIIFLWFARRWRPRRLLSASTYHTRTLFLGHSGFSQSKYSDGLIYYE